MLAQNVVIEARVEVSSETHLAIEIKSSFLLLHFVPIIVEIRSLCTRQRIKSLRFVKSVLCLEEMRNIVPISVICEITARVMQLCGRADRPFLAGSTFFFFFAVTASRTQD